jgi:hypothetical protein
LTLSPPRRVRLVALVAVGLVADAAWAARLVEVRVGRHPEFSRVVFQLDAMAPYTIERQGAQVVVTLQAESEPRTRAGAEWIESVQVEPAGATTRARITLTSEAVEITETTLDGPPRLVLDVRPGSPPRARVPAAAEPPAPPPPREPAPPPAPPPLERVPAKAERPVAEPSPAPPEAPVAPEVPVAPEPAPPPPEPPAPPAPPPAPEPPAPPAPTAQAGDLEVAPPAPPRPAPRPLVLRGLPLGVLAGLVAALALALWLVARARRAARERQDEAGLAATLDQMAASVAEVAPLAGPAPEPFEPPAPSTEAMPMTDFERTDRTEGSETPTVVMPAVGAGRDEVERTRPWSLPDAAFTPEAPAPAAAPVAQVAPDLAQILARVEALEERLGRVESELAAVREERDRAEQQLASQAEELRVQRAAIARTQRVVRGLVNPEGGEGRPGGSSRP